MADDIAKVRSIRTTDALWADLGKRAEQAGKPRGTFVVELLDRPSFSAALNAVMLVGEPPVMDDVVSMAEEPALRPFTAADLKEAAGVLAALAKRWPR